MKIFCYSCQLSRMCFTVFINMKVHMWICKKLICIAFKCYISSIKLYRYDMEGVIWDHHWDLSTMCTYDIDQQVVGNFFESPGIFFQILVGSLTLHVHEEKECTNHAQDVGTPVGKWKLSFPTTKSYFNIEMKFMKLWWVDTLCGHRNSFNRLTLTFGHVFNS